MPATLEQINAPYAGQSYDNPARVIGDWRFFLREFLPSANSIRLVALWLAWNRQSEHQYLSVVGIDNSAVRYERGQCIDAENCIITAHWYMQHGDDGLRAEVDKALSVLIAFVSASEHLETARAG